MYFLPPIFLPARNAAGRKMRLRGDFFREPLPAIFVPIRINTGSVEILVGQRC